MGSAAGGAGHAAEVMVALKKGVTSRISTMAVTLPFLFGVSAAVQRFTKEPVDLVARLGDTVVLPCRVEDKSGELQWTKDQCQVLSSPSSPPIRSSVARLVVVIPSGPPQIVGSSPLVLVAGEEGQVSCE